MIPRFEHATTQPKKPGVPALLFDTRRDIKAATCAASLKNCPMTLIQAILIAILQGVTELFPISSLGHTVVLPALLGWAEIEKSANFLPLVVIMHLGTAVALLVYFWRDWYDFGLALLGRGERAFEERRIFILLVIATVPAALIGYLFEKLLRSAFSTPILAAIFLVVNGVILLAGERIRGAGKQSLDDLTWEGALAIGLAQATALIPGISRSGVTIIGGVIVGLHHKDAARFSFLMATPIIFGAAAHQIPKLDHAQFGWLALISFVVSGIFAYASTTFLMRYFKSHELGALNPFAYYCAVFGFIAIVWLRLM